MEGLTLQELKKRYEKLNKKKGYRGWYESQVKVNQNAGNVPLNNAIFNMAMGNTKSVDMAQVNADNFTGDAPITGAAPDGGVGMVGVAEDYKSKKLQESFDKNRITEVIRNFGTISMLTAEDWEALRNNQASELDRISDDLWMYGNEIKALMDYVFSGNDAYDIQHTYSNVVGVGVNRIFKELQRKDKERRF